jgi:dynein heavy chain, axonemal
VLRASWKKLVKKAEERTDELSKRQARFKRGLIRDIRLFADDVKIFRNDFLKNGPMVQVRAPLSLSSPAMRRTLAGAS